MLQTELNSSESRRLLEAVDRMREILRKEKFSLPEIVVVGDQSVGKSSVLEALSGVHLPRAQNICTRCPLELRMKAISHEEPDHATIRCDGVDEVRVDDLSSVRDLIEDRTNHLAGKDLNVSSSPIYLTVYKQDIRADLTLVDLPGITRNPVGSQSKTIHQDIVNLIKSYIEKPSSIILHVIPSSVDFTTSESIQIAKEYDPKGERQLIAVSKIDKYEKGIGEKLQGIGPGSMMLSMGCVAVLNRSQEEIDEDITFEEMRHREEEFFRQHAAFKNVDARFLGSLQLVKRLATIQQQRIRALLPTINSDLKILLQERKSELKKLPKAVENESDSWGLYMNLVNKYHPMIENRVRGVHCSTESIDNTRKKRKLDDRIALKIYEFQKQFRDQFSELHNRIFENTVVESIRKSLEENASVSLPNFPSFGIVESLYASKHQQFEKPALSMVSECEEYFKAILVDLLHMAFTDSAGYKRDLLYKLEEIVKDSVEESKRLCECRVKEVIQMEKRIFAIRPSYEEKVREIREAFKVYCDKCGVVPTPFSFQKESHTTFELDGVTIDFRKFSKNDLALFDIQVSLAVYCLEAKRRIVDHVSQLCYHWFITKCVLELHNKMSRAFTPSQLFQWMQEPENIKEKRQQLKENIKALEEALVIARNL